jgi:hypothetical protein
MLRGHTRKDLQWTYTHVFLHVYSSPQSWVLGPMQLQPGGTTACTRDGMTMKDVSLSYGSSHRRHPRVQLQV